MEKMREESDNRGVCVVPDGYQRVMPYLIIKGAGAFIEFMREVFGAEEQLKHMRDEHTIMHGELKVGGCVIMYADATEGHEGRPGGFFIYVADADATYQAAISRGATTLSPVSDQPYGRSGGVQDPFGNQWWITTAPAP